MFRQLFQLDDEPTTPADYALIRFGRRAMATQFEIAFPYGMPHALAAADEALDLIDELEDQLTVFRERAEVSRLNAIAATVPTPVAPNLFALLTTCAVWTRETDGAFDIAAGSLVKAWGFYARQGRVPSSRERSAAMATTGMRHVILNAERLTVKYRVPGLEINLGAVGKGYALDRAAELLRCRWGISSALLQAGGSSAFALGHPPGEPRGWQVRLRHPWDADRSLGTVWLRDQGLGTSAATFQHFEYNGRKLGHLLDPRTGWPAEAAASANAIAPTAAEADAMSTAAFVLGSDAERLARMRPRNGFVVLPELRSADPASQRNDTPTTFNLGPDSYSPPRVTPSWT